MTRKRAGGWAALGCEFSKVVLQSVRGTTVATSSFSVTLQGSLSTKSTAPFTLITYTSQNLRTLKMNTTQVPVTYVRFRSTKFTTAANRKLDIRIAAVP